jgi:hypothetical protein
MDADSLCSEVYPANRFGQAGMRIPGIWFSFRIPGGNVVVSGRLIWDLIVTAVLTVAFLIFLVWCFG